MTRTIELLNTAKQLLGAYRQSGEKHLLDDIENLINEAVSEHEEEISEADAEIARAREEPNTLREFR